jgi:acyl-CoA synthetase (AMP-forming)/AMP-acid ligase II
MMASTVLSLLNGKLLRDYYARGLWRDDTIYSIAAAHAAEIPERTALRDRHRQVSWAGLVAAADALAADLAARGLKPGQRITFWTPDRIESVAIMLAASRMGLVCSPSPHRNHTVAEVQAMVERMRAAAFIYQPGFGADARAAGREHAIEAAIAGLSDMRHIYRLPAVTARDAGRPLFDGMLDAASEGAPLPPPSDDPDRVSYIAFTSGSTGNPKGVMHSDNTLLVTARAICRDWRIGPQTVISTLSPFSHNLGVGAMTTALMAGAELVIHDTPRGESLVDRLTEANVEYLIGVPTHAIDIIAELRRRGLKRLGNVRAFRVSGAASPPLVMHELLSFGVEPQSGYGMTENNSHQYTRPGDDPALIAGTCGRACEGYEIRIFDPENPTRELPPGQTGLVAGRGACLMLGYFDDQRASESAVTPDGWFMTGDLGQLDANGYLKLTGRQKEVLIRGGHNISPSRIEDLAAEFAEIFRPAVVSMPDPRLGERICLAYTSQPGTQVDVPALIAQLATRGLSRYELPEFVLPLPELPLMANGKIDKPKLMRQIAAGELAPQPVPASSA